MTSQEKFEAWWWTAMLSCHERFKHRLERDTDGRYAGTDEQAGWLTWQSSRQQALEESAAEAESWKGQKLRLMAGEMSGPELRAARVITTAIARVLRSRAETTGEQP